MSQKEPSAEALAFVDDIINPVRDRLWGEDEGSYKVVCEEWSRKRLSRARQLDSFAAQAVAAQATSQDKWDSEARALIREAGELIKTSENLGNTGKSLDELRAAHAREPDEAMVEATSDKLYGLDLEYSRLSAVEFKARRLAILREFAALAAIGPGRSDRDAHTASQRHHARQNGTRDAITWLHAYADGMSDPHAKAILNSAAFALGTELSQGKIGRPSPEKPPAAISPAAERAKPAASDLERAENIAQLAPTACGACGGPYPNPECGHLLNANYQALQAPCRQ